MKYILILIVVTTISACTKSKADSGPREICHKGIAYLQFDTGVSVKYDTNGQVEKCYAN